MVIPKQLYENDSVKKLLNKILKIYNLKLDVILFDRLDNIITYKKLNNNVTYIPKKMSYKIATYVSTKVNKVNITSPKSMEVVKYLMKNNKTTQLQISHNINVSLGQINKVVKYLRNKNILIYNDKNLELVDIWRLLNEISWHRNMKDLIFEELYLSQNYLNNTDIEYTIIDILNQNNIDYSLCCFSAAKFHSPYMKKHDVIQLYVDNSDIIYKEVFKHIITNEKSNKYIEIFKIDSNQILKDSVLINNIKICTIIQTIIDLMTYGPIGKETAFEIYTKYRDKL